MKAVFFDIGGTIARSGMRFEMHKKLCKEKDIPLAKFLGDYLRIAEMMYTGILTNEQGWTYLLQGLGLKQDPKEFGRFVRDGHQKKLRALPGAIELVAKLKQTHVIGVLSDGIFTKEELEEDLKMLGFPEFDFVLSSTEIGYKKFYPQPFQKILDITGLPAGEVVYVGHQIKERVGAHAVGMKFISLAKNIGEDIYIESLMDVLKHV